MSLDGINLQGFVSKMTDAQVLELSARAQEWKFQKNMNQSTDHSTVFAMISEIHELY